MNRSDLFRGAIMMIVAIFFFSLLDSIAKQLATAHHPLQVVWARYFTQSLYAFIIFAPSLTRLLRTQRLGLQITRSVFLFLATMSFFTALKFLDFASVVAIFEVAPLFITVTAFFVLREHVGPRRWIGVGVGLIGALIIIRPGTSVFSIYALLPVAAAAFFAAYAISTRFLSNGESPWTSFLYTALFGTVASCAIVPLVWTTPTLFNTGLMSLMGVFGGIGHYLLIRAFTTVEASFLAPFSYFGLAFSACWGLLFFAEVPDAATITGAAIIVSAGIYVWYRETFAADKSAASKASV